MWRSRHCTAHPNDALIRNVALVGLLLLTVPLLGKVMGEGKVKCWVPAYFTDSHQEYSNRVCRETDQAQAPIKDSRVKTTTTKVPFKQNTVYWAQGIIDHSGGRGLVQCMAAQAAIAVVSFTLLRSISGRACSQARLLMSTIDGSSNRHKMAARLRNSGWTVTCYVIVETFYFLTMAFMAFLTGISLPSNWSLEAAGVSKVYLCDFSVRQMGNTHRHTLQCISDTSGGVPLVFLYADSVLCGVVSLLVALHTAQMILLGPSSADIMEVFGQEGGNNLYERLRFGFSDLNMAAMFFFKMDAPSITLVQKQEKYNLATPYDIMTKSDGSIPPHVIA